MPSEPDTIRDYLRLHPVSTSYPRQTVAVLAERVAAGEDVLFCTREFLDELARAATEADRARLITERPRSLPDRRHDALLGGLAEHVAAVHGLPRPAWCTEPSRFLDALWFVSANPAFEPMALVQSPAAFRRRGVFLTAGHLQRV